MVKFNSDIQAQHVLFSFTIDGESIAFDQWLDKADSFFNAVSSLNALLEEEKVELKGSFVLVPHSEIAKMSDLLAQNLGLPRTLPWLMTLQNQGTLDRSNFSISVTWREQSQTVVGAERVGAFISRGEERFRIPEPLYSLLEKINEFEQSDTTNQDLRFKIWSEIQDKLRDSIDEGIVETNDFISTIRIVHASSFSLDITPTQDGFSFDPVLYDAIKADPESLQDIKPLLPPIQQEAFAKEKFSGFQKVQKIYALGRGSYVILDENLVKALTVVKDAQRADRTTRKDFARNPQESLKKAFPAVDLDSLENLFVETSEYSERVLEVGLWEKKVIPWVKTNSNTWLPEKFGFKIDDVYIELDETDVAEIQSKVKQALENGDAKITFNGIEIPISQQTQRAVEKLIGFAKPNPEPINPKEPEPDDTVMDADKNNQFVLVIADNFEGVKSGAQFVPRQQFLSNRLPDVLISTLKPHQTEGLEWLQSAWMFGQSGVLLADDMGLGKTLLSLTFLAWLKQAMDSKKIKKRPILIVAPTGLLKNWEEEVDLHFALPGLGDVCRVYGRYLSGLRLEGGNEVNLGTSNLDKERILSADWILTTYETLRDYQHTFGSIRFACGVFDEIQKIKTPGVIVTEASKAMNIDFKIGVTGTPIENRLSDLWCIIDTLEPGLLKDLKSFSQTYEKNAKPETLKELKDFLTLPQPHKSATMLRRMKGTSLSGLPKKIEYIKTCEMPGIQAERYNEAVIAGKSSTGRKGAMLETLHQLKSISLHPFSPEQAEGLSYINFSARFLELFKILDDVKSKNERALIFVESLQIHALLPDLIKQKYNMDTRPMTISGKVSGPKRQDRVNEFEKNNSTFDVMILSPKAGGVGLTLVSANHVIHLSRWWNPAVEDQCTDRIYRMGQTRPVNVYYLLSEHPNYADGSFDYNLNALLEKKRSLSREMLMPPQNDNIDSAELFTKTLGMNNDTDIDTSHVPLKSEEDIACMKPLEFEDYILDVFRSSIYSVERTPKSWDYGADGIVTHLKTGEESIIQIKHTQGDTSCSEAAVEEVIKARDAYKKSKAKLIVITNANGFTSSAQQLAKKENVILIRSSELFLEGNNLK